VTLPVAFSANDGDALRSMTTIDPDTLNGRCEAMMLPQFVGDLPPFRCTREASTDRKGRRVCVTHLNRLRIRYFDDAPDVLSHG
jgi:hypothetical protein